MRKQEIRRPFADRVVDLLQVTEYRRMNTHEDKEAAFRLRYDAYRREDYIPDDPTGKSVDFLDEKPNTETYGLFIAGKLVSSVRISVLTQECPFSPSMIYNAKFLEPKLAAGMIFIDPSRFVTETQAAREFPELPYLAIRVPAMACVHYHVDECLSSVRLTHQAFYKRVFRSKAVTDPVEYQMLNMTIQLMSTTYEAIREDVAKRYPFFTSNYLERRQLFGPSTDMPGITRQVIWNDEPGAWVA